MKRPFVHKGALVIVVLIVGGIAFAKYRRDWSERSPVVMRILCAEDWLNAETLERFARERNLAIEMFTYRDAAEFLRQLANADGRIDLICTSSLLVRSLARSAWIKRLDYDELPGAKQIAADFLNLPYDPRFEWGVPLHWRTFGYLSARAVDGTLKQLSARGRVGVWASMTNYMALLTQSGVAFEDRLDTEDPARLTDEVRRFVASTVPIAPDAARAEPAAWLKRFEVAHVPSSFVPAGAGFFAPGEDGGIVDVGLLAVGERAAHPELGRDLIAASLEPTSAVVQSARSGRGTTLAAGEGEARLKPAQRPSALRATPLTKLRFPDVNGEALLKFSKLFENARHQAH